MRTALCLTALWLAAAPLAASAATPLPYSVRTARVAAADVEKTAKFYAEAFGLREVMRADTPKNAIIMNFGPTVEAARASTSPRVLIEQADPGYRPSDIAHLVFNVPDPQVAIERVTRAGGSLYKAPTTTVRPDATRIASYIKDPAGNVIELMTLR